MTPDRVTVPRILVLTDRRLVPHGRSLEAQVASAVAGGADGVLLRERDLDPVERAGLGKRLHDVARSRPGGQLVWAAPAQEGDSLHLRATDPLPQQRPGLLGRSCHTLDDLRRAADDACDYVTVSPVAATRSKPGYGPPLGARGLRALLEQAAYLDPGAPRVLALGGVGVDNARSFVVAGAHGVAVMGTFMRAASPRAAAAWFLAAVGG